jgi:hypothetical protein
LEASTGERKLIRGIPNWEAEKVCLDHHLYPALSLFYLISQDPSERFVTMAETQKSSKKRPATTQSGPTPKKAHLTKPAKDKETVADKKRSRPVTLPVQDENYDSEEEEFEGFDGGEDDMGLDVEVRADEMNVDSSNAPPKDPNGTLPFLVQLYANIQLVYFGQYALLEIFVRC